MATKNRFSAFGPLATLYKNADVQEILVDGPQDVYFSKKGVVENASKIFKSHKEIETVIRNLFKQNGHAFKAGQHHGDCRLEDGTRIVATLPPLSVRGPVFNIMKMPPQQGINFDQLKKWGAIDQTGIDLLKKIIASRKSLLLAHTPNSGVTTFLNCFLSIIPEDWRVIVLEKNAQIQSERKRLVHLEAQDDSNSAMPQLLDAAKQMRPDYLIYNSPIEREALKLMEVFREGNNGVASLNAEDCMDALKRLEAKCMQAGSGLPAANIREVIASTFPYVALMQMGADGTRRLTEIVEVKVEETGRYQLKTVYHFNLEKKKFESVK